MVSKELFEVTDIIEKLIRLNVWNQDADNEVKKMSLIIYKMAFLRTKKEYISPKIDPFELINNPSLMNYPSILKGINNISKSAIDQIKITGSEVSLMELTEIVHMIVDNTVAQLNAIGK
ncbi:hypothetical protein AB4Y90_00855 [Chryseobacterium sp. 2TAF14]|uniref:hypothetical protein n=1 Tax=Chryseobacterium sp. 2TAF14 TaxID=3233007 RepID=UPI003F90D041